VWRLRFRRFLTGAETSHIFLRAALACDCHIHSTRRRHGHNDRQRHDHLCWVSCFCSGSSPASPLECPVTFTDRQLRRGDIRITRCSCSARGGGRCHATTMRHSGVGSGPAKSRRQYRSQFRVAVALRECRCATRTESRRGRTIMVRARDQNRERSRRPCSNETAYLPAYSDHLQVIGIVLQRPPGGPRSDLSLKRE
jgi:hypothetical protein